ncbi:DUF6636 domain-containing protein [Actinoplanes solisilvae]|uniref:DUF6636 domain-containing protein n=1 Tax=Actinoplanes solisilvae TaxID=2486853 RepID=UPI00196AE984|nr:DUF6636 domain-containing protein [Actinoplanes solisilvae]
MAPIRGLLALALLGVLTACTQTDAPTPTPSTASPSAKSGFGGPAPAPGPARKVDEATFRTPSQNIACALTKSAVRCDIGRKTWEPPAKPADCELDWGNGLAINGGEAAVVCAGDTVLGAADSTLEYGEALRSGTVRCDSENNGMTCKDEKTGHGFTLASSRYTLF